MTARHVVILLFPQFDLIDAGGPYEVFLTAARLDERVGRAASFRVSLASVDGAPVTAFGGMTVAGTVPVTELGDIDVAIIPGTIDVAASRVVKGLPEAVALLAGEARVVASVCTGAFLLADAGILAGRSATTHWEDVPELREHPGIGAVVDDVRWVDTGNVVTSAGLASGVHMALHLVDRLAGRELAQATAAQIDVVWDPDGARPGA